jgi:23S rRNA (uridine2552-2'-O)-methyltransferase
LIGVDLDPVKIDLPNVKTFQCDLNELSPQSDCFKEVSSFDVIQSDAMVKTTGIADSDCARSIALIESGLRLAGEGLLKEKGTFIAKVFEGPGFTEFYIAFKKLFSKTQVVRTEASRQGSREVYVCGFEYKAKKN